MMGRYCDCCHLDKARRRKCPWCGKREDPSKQEIRKRCAAIQATWSAREEVERRAPAYRNPEWDITDYIFGNDDGRYRPKRDDLELDQGG